jgi:hypothetical protein
VSPPRRRAALRAGRLPAGIAVLATLAVAVGVAAASPSPLERHYDPQIPAGYRFAGTVVVPIASSRPAVSGFPLRAGVTYLIRVSGTFFTGAALADAEYFFGGPVKRPQDFDRSRGNVDYGVAIDDPSLAPGHRKRPFWGKLSSSHVYWARYLGKGRPIRIGVHDAVLEDNVPLPRVPGTGPLTLRVYAPPSGS